MKVKLIKFLIKKMKEKGTWIGPRFLEKYFFWEFAYLNFFGKKDFSKLNAN